jgi:SAM-dependent methyltransferase
MHSGTQPTALSADERNWLRSGKWQAFYDGSFAPHLPGSSGTIEQLPWRSGAESASLVEYIAAGRLPYESRVLELGCGTGENLVCLARACRHVTGVDIVPAAVVATEAKLTASGVIASVLVADVLALPEAFVGGFDFVFDCQTYHCARKVDEAAAAAAVCSLLAPGGRLMLLTGNADEPEERGPERLSREDLDRAFATRGLVCEECVPFRFDMTDAYRRQAHAEPPLGWRSVWLRPEQPDAVSTSSL